MPKILLSNLVGDSKGARAKNIERNSYITEF